MSRQDEIGKIAKILNKQGVYITRFEVAEYLVDNGIRSKDGFEIEYGISPNLGLSAIGIKPVDYGEEKNEHTQ